MSSPFPNIPLTLPPLPTFPGIFQQTPGTTQQNPFNNQQTTVLQNFASPLGGFNTNVITAGAQDLFNAEQTLQSNNTTLNTLITNIIGLNTALSTPSATSNLTSILSSPNLTSFLSSILSNSTVIANLATLGSSTALAQNLSTLLSLATNPASILSSLITSNTSSGIPSSIYTVLNSQAGGSTGKQAQTLVRPFVNTLFGTSPAASSLTDPFDVLFSLVQNPSSFLTSFLPPAFPTFPTIGVSSVRNVNPQTFITDLLSNGPVGTDFLSIIATALPAGFQLNGWTSNPQIVLTDLLNNPQNVPCDLLSLINIANYIPSSTSFNGAPTNANLVSLCQMLNGMITSFQQTAGLLFTGNPMGIQSNGLSFFVSTDHLYYGTNNGATGYYNAGVGPTPPGGGFFMPGVQGILGYVMANVLLGAGEIQIAPSSGSPITQVASGAMFLANAVMALMSAVGTIASMFANIQNFLNQSPISGSFLGIPTSPNNFFNTFMKTSIGLPASGQFL